MNLKKIKYTVLAILACGNMSMAWTTNYYINNQATTITGPDLTGNDYGIVMVNNSDVTNNSGISASSSGSCLFSSISLPISG